MALIPWLALWSAYISKMNAARRTPMLIQKASSGISSVRLMPWMITSVVSLCSPPWSAFWIAW